MPKDINGFSDPYVVLQLGKQTIDDVDARKLKTLKPDFYKMYELRTQLPGTPLLQVYSSSRRLAVVVGGCDTWLSLGRIMPSVFCEGAPW